MQSLISRRIACAAFFVCSFCAPWVLADTQTALWQQAAVKQTRPLPYQDWQQLLDKYLVVADSGIHLFRYGAVSSKDKQQLSQYIRELANIPPATLTKDQQMAYWINLYNALTVQLILDAYPVSSIKRVGSWFNLGPWDQDVVKVAGYQLSLNDIEHRILRPIWQDPRIHYAVNCASIGCPNLAKQAYRASQLEAMLEQQAQEFINHPRGVRIIKNQLHLSSIYHWYQDDFGTFSQLKQHLQQYASPALKQALATVSEHYEHDYDWSLNEIK